MWGGGGGGGGLMEGRWIGGGLLVEVVACGLVVVDACTWAYWGRIGRYYFVDACTQAVRVKVATLVLVRVRGRTGILSTREGIGSIMVR